MIKVLIAESLDIDKLHQISAENNYSVITDKNNPVSSNKQVSFYYNPEITYNQLLSQIEDYDALIVRPKEVDSNIIKNSKKLKLIIRGGSGLNSIDIECARKNNITVLNTPGQNSDATAEFAFNLMLEIIAKRNIRKCNEDIINNRTTATDDYLGYELAGKKIAIIGMGNTGQRLAKMADAFSMQVTYYNRSVKDVDYKFFATIDELLEDKPDIISLNIPLTPQMNGFFSTEYFNLMKKGSYLINCARPQLVDIDAFSNALNDGTLKSAAIDGDLDLIEPFVKADTNKKCIFTHHIADCTKQAMEKITNACLTHVKEFFA